MQHELKYISERWPHMQVELSDATIYAIEKTLVEVEGRGGPMPIVDDALIRRLADIASELNGKLEEADEAFKERDEMEREKDEAEDERDEMHAIICDAISNLDDALGEIEDSPADAVAAIKAVIKDLRKA